MNIARLAGSTFLRHICRRGLRLSSINNELRPLLMAALSPTMEKGNIVAWNFKEGDLVESGSSICEIETDKAVVGLDAIDDTVLVKIVVPEGSKDIALGTLIGWTADKGDNISGLKIPDDYQSTASGDQSKDNADTSKSDKPTTLFTSGSSGQSSADDSGSDESHRGKIKASPAVRALISRHNINAQKLKGTGPRGTITKSDVEEYLARSGGGGSSSDGVSLQNELTDATVKPPYTDMPVSTVRGIVASRLSLSKRTIPHEYCSIDCCTDAIDRRRKLLKEAGHKVSVNDFIVKATALALKLVPELNGIFENDQAVLRSNVDIAVAVSIPDGLITPVVRQADGLSLLNISSAVKDLATRARDRKLAPEEFQGSSFTISNLGMFGVDLFSAVINPPEMGILAIGTSRSVLGIDGSTHKMMNVTLSYDGRAISPPIAAKFLQYFKGFVENPAMLEVGGTSPL